jgi:bisphosphoglycerate-dependent phosphoglycerate mutase family 1
MSISSVAYAYLCYMISRACSQGRLQAVAAGTCLANLLPDIAYDVVFTSLLSRSLDTYSLIAEQMSQQQHKSVRHVATWRLNERHYGALVGLSKSQAEAKLGKERVMGWRRSWDLKYSPDAYIKRIA